MKNKTLYAILGIGAAYLIWRYYQKSKGTPTTIVSPGFPTTPISVTTPSTSQTAVRTLEHGYDEGSAPAVYQTYYGVVNGTTKKVPVLC